MRALVLGEASNTVDREGERAIDYFRGSFLPVAQLVDGLSDICPTQTLIISETHGLLGGDQEVVVDESSISVEQLFRETRQRFLEEADGADVVVILTTSNVFQEVFADEWSGVAGRAAPDSVWCIGTSRMALNSVELDELASLVEKLFVYQRVGVAPINRETRERLLEYVSAKIR